MNGIEITDGWEDKLKSILLLGKWSHSQFIHGICRPTNCKNHGGSMQEGTSYPTLYMHWNSIILLKQLLFLWNLIFKLPVWSSTYGPLSNLTESQKIPQHLGSVTAHQPQQLTTSNEPSIILKTRFPQKIILYHLYTTIYSYVFSKDSL